MELHNTLKTGKSLQWSIDNKAEVNGLEEYLDQHFAYTYFELDYGSNPTWSEALYNNALFEPSYWMLEGAIDYAMNGNYDYDIDDVRCQYQPGYYEPLNYSDIIQVDGNSYRYIGSIPLPKEIEHQADNGNLTYEYRGYSYVRILEKITD